MRIFVYWKPDSHVKHKNRNDSAVNQENSIYEVTEA